MFKKIVLTANEWDLPMISKGLLAIRTISSAILNKLKEVVVNDENSSSKIESEKRLFNLLQKKYREDSSTFEIPYFVAKFVARMVAKVMGPEVAVVLQLILTPVKLSSQP
ncbi:hypothetical protein AVEN_133907-1 [Araneus ventricosus]|uniref:Uncharacterized protein n=1 Tax=Araneus ventricosus TaxID=182803 RepID=A0A4Y2D369_ARAVE|nr:hypothetical protein AVEN_133907-1 [Araneus ventricosus]